jgi:hypothetical protein
MSPDLLNVFREFIEAFIRTETDLDLIGLSLAVLNSIYQTYLTEEESKKIIPLFLGFLFLGFIKNEEMPVGVRIVAIQELSQFKPFFHAENTDVLVDLLKFACTSKLEWSLQKNIFEMLQHAQYVLCGNPDVAPVLNSFLVELQIPQLYYDQTTRCIKFLQPLLTDPLRQLVVSKLFEALKAFYELRNINAQQAIILALYHYRHDLTLNQKINLLCSCAFKMNHGSLMAANLSLIYDDFLESYQRRALQQKLNNDDVVEYIMRFTR